MPSDRDASIAARSSWVAARAHQRRSAMPLTDSSALAGVGFDVLCEVVGAVSVVDPGGGFYSSGYIAGENIPFAAYTSSPATQRVGVPGSLTTRRTALATAMRRLRDEARILGADGVVGVRAEFTFAHAQGASEVVGTLGVLVHGVAVRASHRHTPGAPVTTSMSGTQVASALRGGLVPVAFLQVPLMGIRQIDPASSRQRRRRAPNGEVEALTDVVTVCRSRARDEFERAAARAGGDTSVIDSMTLFVHGESREAAHCTATVVVTGTALATFTPQTTRPAPLTMLSLADRREKTL